MNTSFTITCSAQANPPAKYRFYKEEESLFNTTNGRDAGTYTTSARERVSQVNYSCTPFNEYGDGPNVAITVNGVLGTVCLLFLVVTQRKKITIPTLNPVSVMVVRGSWSC